MPSPSPAANTGEGGRPMVVPTVYGRKRKRASGFPEVRGCQQICERSINLDLFHFQISDHHNKNLHYLPCQFRQTDCCLTLSNTYPYGNSNHFRDLCFNVEFTVIHCLGAGNFLRILVPYYSILSLIMQSPFLSHTMLCFI